MTDFTKDELHFIANGLDRLIRDEGSAMNQGGASGLLEGRAARLGPKVTTVMGAFEKVRARLAEIDALEAEAKAAAAGKPKATTAPSKKGKK